MRLTGLKRSLARALVRTTTAKRAYPEADWSCVLEAEEIKPADADPPPFAPEARHLSTSAYATPRVTTAALRGLLHYSYLNVLLTPLRTILLDSDNTYLEHPGSAAADKFYWRKLYERPVETISGPSFVLRSPANNYYHTLVDNLPRLYALQQRRYADLSISLLVPGRLRPYEEYLLPRVLPRNVEIRTIKRDRLYRLEHALFGSYLSRQMSGYLPKAYLDFFLGRVLPDRPRRRCNRIYISRSKAPGGRRVVNEDELLTMLQRFGFRSHALEELSLSEQIDLFFDAEAVVGAHGAGLTNLLFSERADVVELHPGPAVFPHYYFLSCALGHRYRFVCSRAESRHSDLVVDVDAVAAALDALERRSPSG